MFNNAREVIELIKSNLIDYKSAIFLGAGDMGLETATFDLTVPHIAYEWADEQVTNLRARGIKAIKQDITLLSEIKADVVTFYDTLEHMNKTDALEVLRRVDAKQIVMFIPIQDKYRQDLPKLQDMQDEAQKNNKQMTQHLSLWTPKEMEDLGFKVWYKDRYFGANHNYWGAMVCIKNNKLYE